MERILSTLGYDYASDDHWRQRQHEFQLDDQTRQEDAQPEETEEVAGMVSAGLQPSNGFEDCESSMSIGRLLGSVVKRRKLSKSDLPNEEGSPRSVQRSELEEKMCKMFVSTATAPRLLDEWIIYLSKQYPVIHTPRLRELHAK